MARRGENIRKRKDGRWEGRYYTQESQSSRSTVHSVYAKTYGEVKEKLSAAKLSAKSVSEKYDNSKEIYFHKAAEEWLALINREKKYATYMKYYTIYEKYIRKEVGEVLLSELTSEKLSGIFQREEQGNLSGSIQNSISCVLKQILDYAVCHRYLAAIPYFRPRRRTSTRPAEVLNASEQTRLLHYLYKEMDIYKLGIVICISTGLRLGEICSLKWKDIDLEEKFLYVNTTVQRIAMDGRATKTTLLEGEPKSIFSKREVPLSDEINHLLCNYYTGSDEYVINGNSPMEPRTYQMKFQKYLEYAGVKKTNFHTMRHTFATNCVNGGVDIKSLSEILGHSDVKITLNRYVHPTAEVKRMHMNTISAIYGQFMGQQC